MRYSEEERGRYVTTEEMHRVLSVLFSSLAGLIMSSVLAVFAIGAGFLIPRPLMGGYVVWVYWISFARNYVEVREKQRREGENKRSGRALSYSYVSVCRNERVSAFAIQLHEQYRSHSRRQWVCCNNWRAGTGQRREEGRGRERHTERETNTHTERDRQRRRVNERHEREERQRLI